MLYGPASIVVFLGVGLLLFVAALLLRAGRCRSTPGTTGMQPQAAMCERCGEQLRRAVAYCPHCGQRLRAL